MLTIKQFKEYDRTHPMIWTVFEKFSLRAISRGLKRISGKAVMEEVRTYAFYEVPGRNKDFKVGNTWTSFYVRKFLLKYPYHRALYQCGKSAADGLKRSDFDKDWRPKWQ